MARYINADDLTKKIFPLGMIDNGNFAVHAKAVKIAIESTPTADVVEVVRCKDCANSKHWYADKRRCFLWCETGIGVYENSFCSYGERKEKE